MKRTLVRLTLFLCAGALGWGASELLVRMQFGRELVARFSESEGSVRVETNLRNAAAGEQVSDTVIDHQLELFRDRFADEQQFKDALRAVRLSLSDLRKEATENLRARAWIEKQIGPHLQVNDEDVRSYFASNHAQFTQPTRWRARHLFLAAPDGYPDDVIKTKRSAIEALSIRRIDGEDFSALIAEGSEDEATKLHGGDLNYFAAARMPPEFIDAIKALRVGEISGPVRSHLGFHLLEVTETKPEREMSFEEARPEIALALSNQRRALAVAALRERLGTPEFKAH